MSSEVATSNCGDTPRESLIFQRARGLDCRRVRESAGGADPCDAVDVIRSNTTGAGHIVT